MQTFFQKKLQKTFFLLLFVYFILPVTYYFCNNMHFFRFLIHSLIKDILMLFFAEPIFFSTFAPD